MAKESKESGAVYVSSSGAYYSAPSIDADKLNDVLGNTYIAEQMSKVSSQIFGGMYALHVRDRDEEVDEELSKRMRSMAESKDVRLWSRMKQTWEDSFGWGAAVLNPVWSRDGAELVLAKLRRLPPYSFRSPPPGVIETYSEILRGITLNKDGEIEVHQVQSALEFAPVKLEDCALIKDPRSDALAGTSQVIPLVPVISMLDFCWSAQMQKINRVGAPIFFIRVTQPKGDDIAFAQQIVKNWGKSSAYHLRANMEVVELDLSDNEAALATIATLEQRVKAHFKPNSAVQKEGATIGGNASAEKELIDAWIEGERAWVEDEFETLLQHYLDANGYAGYTVELAIDSRPSVPGDLELRQAQVGFQTRALSVNEVRALLNHGELDGDGLKEVADQWAVTAPPAAPAPLGFAAHDKEHVPTKEETKAERELHQHCDDAFEELLKVL